MSGGAFDYNRFQLEYIVDTIEKAIAKNGKTVQQIWDEKSEEEQEDASDYERPMSALHHPWWVDDEAEERAYKAIGRDGHAGFDGLTQSEIDKWNEVRLNERRRIIDENNNSVDGPVYSKKTLSEFKRAIKAIQKALVYMRCVDLLLSGDDGENGFHERLKEDLDELKSQENKKDEH